MLVTELYHGQGIGNQLFVYVSTRAIASKLGYDLVLWDYKILEILESIRMDFIF